MRAREHAGQLRKLVHIGDAQHHAFRGDQGAPVVTAGLWLHQRDVRALDRLGRLAVVAGGILPDVENRAVGQAAEVGMGEWGQVSHGAPPE